MKKTSSVLNRNVLKLIAFAAMLADHAAVLLFDGFVPLRIVGRLSFPIFAYMITEGCLHTSNRLRYFLRLFVLGVVCNLIYFVAARQLTLSIFITFSLSFLPSPIFSAERPHLSVPSVLRSITVFSAF